MREILGKEGEVDADQGAGSDGERGSFSEAILQHLHSVTLIVFPCISCNTCQNIRGEETDSIGSAAPQQQQPTNSKKTGGRLKTLVRAQVHTFEQIDTSVPIKAFLLRDISI